MKIQDRAAIIQQLIQQKLEEKVELSKKISLLDTELSGLVVELSEGRVCVECEKYFVPTKKDSRIRFCSTQCGNRFAARNFHTQQKEKAKQKV